MTYAIIPLAAACLGLLVAWRVESRRRATAQRIAAYERLVRQQLLDANRRLTQRLDLAEGEIAHLRAEAELERRFAGRMEELAKDLAAAAGPVVTLTMTEESEPAPAAPLTFQVQRHVAARAELRFDGGGWDWKGPVSFWIHDPEEAA